MALDRYARSKKLSMGQMFGTQRAMRPLYKAAQSGAITATQHVTKERQRLDILAGQIYGDGRLWWVIAAASGIGWGLQIPAGTVLTIPTNLSEVEGIVG